MDDKFILIGCDGIWEKFSNDELCDMVEEGIKLKKNGEEILSGLLEKNLASDTTEGIGCDNMTAILLVFKN